MVDKLTGGHSGDDINKRRANANKILARFLYNIWEQFDARLIDIKGGNLHNAIPRDAQAVVAVPAKDKEAVRVAFNVFAAEVQDEYHVEEPTMEFKMESVADTADAIDPQTARNLIFALEALHNGILEMNQDIPTLVETSSNLASVRTNDDTIVIVTSQRSSAISARDNMCRTIAATFRLAGADVEIGDGYPGWKPNPHSKLLQITVDAYKRLFGKEPVVRAIHAGRECGLFSEEYPHLDMVSFCPTLRGVQSPDERLEIKTVDMVWRHLVEVLRCL
jgi:dipeptidase D